MYFVILNLTIIVAVSISLYYFFKVRLFKPMQCLKNENEDKLFEINKLLTMVTTSLYEMGVTLNVRENELDAIKNELDARENELDEREEYLKKSWWSFKWL